MIDEKKIDSAIKDLFEHIEFKSEPKGLYDPLRYMIEIGGKRLRPRLCLLTYSLYQDELGPWILSPTEALEVFHSFTLIHDDIMDKSPLRRKSQTVWKKWNSDTAVLSGDVMCIDSYSRIAKAPIEKLPGVMEIFSQTASQVCEGQQYDMDFEGKIAVSMDDYMKMISLKTGVLIACAAKIGAYIGGASEDDCNNLYDYGMNLGLAFQIADDYLDAFGDEKVFGKPIGGDIVNNKKSWLTLRALEKAKGQCKDSLVKAMGLSAGNESQRKFKIEAVKEIYTSLKVDEDAKQTIVELSNKALACAEKVCDGKKLDLLKSFAEKLIGRDY